jgi:ribosomal protein L11 methyltransferase
LQLSLKTAPAAQDAITNFLVERGSSGVVLKEDEVRAYFPSSADDLALKREIRRFLKGVIEFFPECAGQRIRWTTLKDRNWNNSWRKFFCPQKVGKSLLVIPPWLSPASRSRRKVITIEPGMAFGTGTHPTTQGCLEFLEEVTGSMKRKGLTGLDVGTGSGILAIAMAKMGVPKVLAIDNDPVALKTAAENVQLNETAAAVRLSDAELRRVTGTFAIVVANLTAETIIDLRPALEKKVARRGHLILSGILTRKVPEVVRSFDPDAFELVRRKSGKEWSTLLFARAA